MSLSDPIADMLTRIRNALQARHEKVSMSLSKQKLVILDILKDEGFIKGYNAQRTEKKAKGLVEVDLKYYQSKPVIRVIERISCPSLRYYVKAKDLSAVRNNMGIAIVSTSKGMMTGRQAKKLNLGGELICRLW